MDIPLYNKTTFDLHEKMSCNTLVFEQPLLYLDVCETFCIRFFHVWIVQYYENKGSKILLIEINENKVMTEARQIRSFKLMVDYRQEFQSWL